MRLQDELPRHVAVDGRRVRVDLEYRNVLRMIDWLSRDEAQVDQYVSDPYCGGICSISFYKNLTGGMARMGKPGLIRNVPKDLPIYIQGGSMDPVSDMGKGLYALRDQYVKLGLVRVEMDVYEGARHEIFNETNRMEVYRNTLAFIESIV